MAAAEAVGVEVAATAVAVAEVDQSAIRAEEVVAAGDPALGVAVAAVEDPPSVIGAETEVIAPTIGAASAPFERTAEIKAGLLGSASKGRTAGIGELFVTLALAAMTGTTSAAMAAALSGGQASPFGCMTAIITGTASGSAAARS